MTAKKILSPRAAVAWRKRRRRVVFTNGVFDILHPGHIALLEKARSFGDYLIVGVNSDASVRRLGKGPERPLNALKARQRLLAALACVDAVTSFREDTPAELLSRLKPDVLVKGADYKASEVAGREHAKRLRRVRLKPGHSTTRIVNKLKKK